MDTGGKILSLRYVARLIALAVACLLPFSAQAAFMHDSRLDWYTLHSPHFHLHYHEGLEEMARETLSLAEAVHKKLSKDLQWTPAEPVNLVLTDEFDLSNGMASPLPSNWIMLFTTPPDDLNSLEDYASWMELLLIHEYTHILHLDKVRGAPSTLQNVFGRLPLLFPNVYQPTWMVEGYATYIETDKKRGVGRGQSSLYDAMMRAELLHGLKPIRQVNQPLASWPSGTAYYLYGVHFYQFLEHTYGKSRIQGLIENYSDNILPFFINNNASLVLGKDLSDLWDDFEKYLEQKYRPQINKIKKQGLVEGKQLSTDGYFTSQLKVLPDGRAYYISYNGERHTALMMIDQAGEIHRLRNVNFGTRIDVHPKAGVLLIQPERCHNGPIYYDLYRVDLDGGDLDQLTDCARYRNAAWSPDGRQILAVHNKAGKNELHLLEMAQDRKTVLWSGVQWDVVGALDWSPDGKQVVAQVWRNKSGWNLEQFDLQTRRWTKLTQDAAIEGHPQYTPDGKAVVFTSEHGGVYNIRRRNLATGKVETLTNVLTGALSPGISTKGELFYLGYTGEGLDVFKLASTEQKITTLPAAQKGPTGQALFTPEKFDAGQSEAYSAWNSLKPRWWFPHLLIDNDRDEFGAMTAGWDSLLQHLYAIDVAYDSSNSLWLGNFQYVYDGWYPMIKYETSIDHTFSYDRFDNRQRIRRAYSQILEVVFPLLSMDSSWTLNFAAIKDNGKDERVAPGLLANPSTIDNVAGIALVYDSTESHIKSISRTSGRDVTLVAEDSDAIGESDYTGKTYLGDWKEFFRLGGEHVLAFRYAEGKGSGDSRPFRLGGIKDDGNSYSLIADPISGSPFNRRRFSLRGYKEGLPHLSGQRMRLASLEYRFPITRIERGFMAPPLGIHQLHTTLFYEAGSAWDTGNDPDEYYRSAGIEFNTDATFFYFATLQIAVGYAKGLDLGGEERWYLRLGSAF